MRRLAWLALTPFSLCAAADSARPRGVGPEFAKHFKSKDLFTCIFNPSITISASQVNDDYCDCPDGSDEPGTSACSVLLPNSPNPSPEYAHVNTSLALPGFYCKNKGHRPSYLPFEQVNDGVCDYELCCDGSDEFDRVGGVSCLDRCKEIGKEWRRQDEARQKSMGAALKQKKALILEAARLRKEVEDRIVSLGAEITGAELKVKALEQQFADIERREKGKMVRSSGLDGNKAGSVGMLAGLAKERIGELRGSLVEVRSMRDKSRARITELEKILSSLKEEYNPNFNDDGVKRAVRSWEEYAARDKDDAVDEETEKDLDAVLEPDSDTNGINWTEWEKHEEDELDLLYKFEAYLPPSLRSWIDEKLRDLRVFLIDNGILARRDDGSESPAVTSARNELSTAQERLGELRRDLDSHTADKNRDYGPADVFRALKGKSVSRDVGEYTYELFWLDRTVQRPRRGGGETSMGGWDGKLGSLVVDEALPVDGRGLGSGERTTLHFSQGQHCWNGPSRSTTVVLGCAEKDEIWRVFEEEKCVYRMEVGTPAVCDGASASSGSGTGSGTAGEFKDEL